MELVFDHLGLVVKDLSAARAHLQLTLGVNEWSEIFHDGGIGVAVQFGRSAHSPCMELIAPLGDGSPVSGALAQGKNVLNHVAYLVDDIEAGAEHLRSTGCFPAGEAMPAVAYGGRRVQFFLSPLRFIVELIEAPGHQHNFEVI